MSWGLTLRIVLLGAVTALFVGSLLAIVVTGPVIVRAPRLDFDRTPVSAERLRRDVTRLCGEFTPRSYEHRANLDRAAEWIAGELRTAGLEVELQDYRVRDEVYRNVVGLRRGTDSAAPVVVLGAHYDAYREFPGADDNASGVAVLLEVARTLPRLPTRRDRYFVAFSTEEPPFFDSESMGSHVFAEGLVRDGREVSLMIALDLVGYFSDAPSSQQFPTPLLRALYPGRGNFIAVVGDLGAGRWIGEVKRGMMSTRALPVYSFRAPANLVPVTWSDHLSFRRLGLPGVQVTDTAFMRYRHYHTAEDTPDKLDYERMARVVEALQGVLWESPPG